MRARRACITLLVWLLLVATITQTVASGVPALNHTLPNPEHPEWRKYLSQLCMLQVGTQPLCNILGNLMEYNFTLTPAQLRKSLTYIGPNNRMRRVVWDLMTGARTVHIGVIGTSISWGTGASKVGVTDWFSQVKPTLLAAFPKAKLETHNGCFPATGSAFANMCISHMVQPQVDLLFIEFVTNDQTTGSFFYDSAMMAYERLLRKALKKANLPAVVLMQVPNWGQAFEPTNPNSRTFHESLEDMYGALAQYYTLPWLSLRNAVWKDAHMRTGFKGGWREFMAEDLVHPSDKGHRLLLDLFMWLVHETAIDLTIMPFSRADTAAIRELLAPPMHRGNYEELTEMCNMGDDLRRLVSESASPAWSFINEGTPQKKKTGYVGTTPLAPLVLELDLASMLSTNISHLLGMPETLRMGTVMVSYLKSYDHMGQAAVRCVQGCICEEQVIDAQESKQRTSTAQLAIFSVEVTAPICTMHVVIITNTTSGEHKFKVIAVMMSRRDGNVFRQGKPGEWPSGDMLGAEQPAV